MGFVQEIVSEKSCLRFVVDTLTFLHRGGRCSGAAALLGNTLKLHPKIVVSEGSMRPDKKYRGSIDKCYMNYVKDMQDELLKAKKDRVFITHSGCSRPVTAMCCICTGATER